MISDSDQFMDFDKLKSLSNKVGYGDISKRDIKILLECLDMDRDGKVSIDDFTEMVNFIQSK